MPSFLLLWRDMDQWRVVYEEKFRSCSGIGFILMGIGPHGHQESDHNCTTRLDESHCKSQAAANFDLGGFTGSNMMTDKELLARKTVRERLGQHLANGDVDVGTGKWRQATLLPVPKF